jgi:hypothetical protein
MGSFLNSLPEINIAARHFQNSFLRDWSFVGYENEMNALLNDQERANYHSQRPRRSLLPYNFDELFRPLFIDINPVSFANELHQIIIKFKCTAGKTLALWNINKPALLRLRGSLKN